MSVKKPYLKLTNVAPTQQLAEVSGKLRMAENDDLRQGETKVGRLASVRRVIASVSVEPVLVLSMITTMLVQVISQSWLLRLACEQRCSITSTENIQYNYTSGNSSNCDCDGELQEELQRTVAQIQAWRSAVEFSMPLVLVPLLGAWSDSKSGRRLPVMLFAISGRLVQTGLVLVLLQTSPSLTVAGLSLALPVSLTASSMAIDMAAYSHISDTTHIKVRTVRLGMANAFWCLGAVLGLLASGLLHHAGGETLVFTVAFVLQFLAALIAIWRMRGPTRVEQMERVAKACGCRLFLEPLEVATKAREGRGRALISLMLVNLLLAYGASCGRQAVMFLYTRLRFGWNEVEYGLYGTFLMLMEVVGSVIAMTLFSHRLGLPDAVVGLMSCVSQVLSSTFYTFASSTRGMYIAPLVETANGQVVVIPRAIVTKLTDPQEQGKVHALFGCVEAVVPLLFEPIYHSMYRATLSTVPQAVFWLSAALTLPPTALFIWLQWGSGKNWADIPRHRKAKRIVNSTLETAELESLQ